MSEKLINKMKKRINGKGRQCPKKRVTTVNNSFVQGVLPFKASDDKSISKYLNSFKKNKKKNLLCIYCNTREATTIDHLNPIVKSGLPAGSYDEINNFVPACGSCNSSKSGAEWKDWLEKQGEKSSRKRVVDNPTDAIKRVETFVKKHKANIVDFKHLVKKAGVEKEYNEYINIQKKVKKLLNDASKKAIVIQSAVNKKV